MESQICWIFGTPWPCLTPSEWAAWAQAIGTVFAIGIAIYVPWRQRKDQIRDVDRARDELRISMAQALIGPLDDLRASARLAREVIALDDYNVHLKKLPGKLFQPSTEFQIFRTHLHLLGETGKNVNLVLANAQTAQIFVDDSNSDQHLEDRHVRSMTDLLDRLISRSTTALNDLYRLTDINPIKNDHEPSVR